MYNKKANLVFKLEQKIIMAEENSAVLKLLRDPTCAKLFCAVGFKYPYTSTLPHFIYSCTNSSALDIAFLHHFQHIRVISEEK